ncbi:MAG: (2Fe-2S)-binding protein [Tannerellaceae bacterium]|jgi:predicted molibdopterin-dependent oxidoreductase YjgC|nr:(2Fe-2S)-binding protein [Tannerellaceae bacterium]
MQITINNIPVEASGEETILRAARRAGIEIPSLCSAEGAVHKSSCMVCAVRSGAAGQIIPACTTLATEGMEIVTDSEDVLLVRTLSLELLLSDHRADCEAPCSMLCPSGLDVERMLGYYDTGQHREAAEMIRAAFPLPGKECDACKAPCEKACRRGTVDQAVTIRAIIREVIEKEHLPAGNEAPPRPPKDKNLFYSRLGRFTEKEKSRLKETVATPSRCLHCACAGRTDCKLRLYATAENIRRPRYDMSSSLPAMEKIHVGGRLWFEPAKCIRCGLCVYNSRNGFTFRDRGFGMQIVLPEENRPNVSEELAGLCPTGAIYLIEN